MLEVLLNHNGHFWTHSLTGISGCYCNTTAIKCFRTESKTRSTYWLPLHQRINPKQIKVPKLRMSIIMSCVPFLVIPWQSSLNKSSCIWRLLKGNCNLAQPCYLNFTRTKPLPSQWAFSVLRLHKEVLAAVLSNQSQNRLRQKFLSHLLGNDVASMARWLTW